MRAIDVLFVFVFLMTLVNYILGIEFTFNLKQNLTLEIMYEFISKPLCEVDVHDNHVTENEAQSVESNKKKHKSTTFNCWKFFTRIGVCDD